MLNQMKAEIMRCFDSTDRLGQELILAQARSLQELRPASAKPLLRVVGGVSSSAYSGDQADVLHLGQGEALEFRG